MSAPATGPGPRVLFVSGKGGVGKTSVAAATALARARAGQRVLLVSTDPAHNLGHVWDRTLGDDPVRVVSCPGGGHVDGVEIDPAATVERHLRAVGTTLRRLLPERLHAAAEQHLALAREAPGTHESAVLERVAEAVEDGLTSHDTVVFDTAPTGHTLRLMALPEQLSAWTGTLLANRDRADRFGAALRGLGGGPAREVDRDAELRRVLVARRRRLGGLRDAVQDPATTSFLLVLTAERLPVAETLELHRQLVALGIDVGGLVVNRRSPADAGDLLAQRRRVEDTHLVAVRAALADVPLLEVPLLPGDLVGEAALGVLADALTRARTAGAAEGA
ncbi:ArsA family ATPase [Nocardioides dokdonensis]|uniref:ArsA family ATPase n=1 Tax=Nocardioides dokdonensis TaxID=450734 RepID=UPI0012F7E3B7|nr:ArsA family ATPase [Nocardioides dokdonensis]